MQNGLKLGKCSSFHTIAAPTGDQDVWRRGLTWTWAEWVQAVEWILPAVSWRWKRVAALRVPAVDIAAVPDVAFRALCLLSFLNMLKHNVGKEIDIKKSPISYPVFM